MGPALALLLGLALTTPFAFPVEGCAEDLELMPSLSVATADPTLTQPLLEPVVVPTSLYNPVEMVSLQPITVIQPESTPPPIQVLLMPLSGSGLTLTRPANILQAIPPINPFGDPLSTR